MDTATSTASRPAAAAGRRLRVSLYAIAVTQLVLGLVFLIPDSPVVDLLGLRPRAPHWANWLLTMMAALLWWHPARDRYRDA